jgi:hypothetical protein
MEMKMKLRALMFLGFAGLIAQPALAQAAPNSVQATIDSLLAAGYEVKAVNMMSDAAVKEVFPTANAPGSQLFITLQKGTSVAVCEDATSTWLNLADAQMTDATRCWKR